MRRGAPLVFALVAITACTPGPQAATGASPSVSPLQVATPAPSPSPVTYAAPRLRAMWVDAFHDGIKSPAQVEKLVADAHRANLNALLVQVRKRGDAYFNLADEPRAADITGSRGFDPLGYLIRLAHASTPRIQVHAWVNTFFVGETSGAYLKHPDWVDRAIDGSTGGYLDPGVPAVQAYTHRVFMDIALRYDVDGVHLDFIRYPGADWGYSAEALRLFKLAGGSFRLGADGTYDYSFAYASSHPQFGQTGGSTKHGGRYRLDGDVVLIEPTPPINYKFTCCAVGLGTRQTREGLKRVLVTVSATSDGGFRAPPLVPNWDSYDGTMTWFVEQ